MHSSGLQISLKIIAGWMLYIRMTYAWLILNISPGKQKNVLLRFDTIYRRDGHVTTASTDWPLTKRVTSQWHHIPGIWLAEGEAAGWLTCEVCWSPGLLPISAECIKNATRSGTSEFVASRWLVRFIWPHKYLMSRCGLGLACAAGWQQG